VDAAARAAAEAGQAALQGEPGPAFDALVYAASIVLHHIGRADSLADAGERVRHVLNNGQAAERFAALAA